MTTKKSRNLLQYSVEPDDVAIICTADRNHGRICKVLHEWDGRSVMSNDFKHLIEKNCFVVMSLGSPFAIENKETNLYYNISASHLLVVETSKLKRLAHASDIKWNEWK